VIAGVRRVRDSECRVSSECLFQASLGADNLVPLHPVFGAGEDRSIADDAIIDEPSVKLLRLFMRVEWKVLDHNSPPSKRFRV
jgi:hypothetical protein